MAVSWLIWLLTASIFVSLVLLAVVCLQCRSKGPLAVSIRQANPSGDYMPSTHQFRVIHPSQQSIGLNSIHFSPNELSPYLTSADPGSQLRHASFTPTETESNPSYENPGLQESDAEDPGYIIVLPEDATPLTNQSRASTPSSDVQHDYENVPKKEGQDYLNVEPLHFHTGSSADLSAQSDSDDEEANYVNVLDGPQAE